MMFFSMLHTDITPLISPRALRQTQPLTPRAAITTQQARENIQQLLQGNDDRLLVVIGPCSIDNLGAAFDYAQRLDSLAKSLQDTLIVVMRSYVEKPRSCLGWKGWINDPHLDGSFDVNYGLKTARSLLLAINELGLAAATEWVNPFTAPYLSDLIAWGAFGARTSASPPHRELASNLAYPIGFKNSTDGNIVVAIDAIHTARSKHYFFGINSEGQAAIIHSHGNPYSHIILRGGQQPNYDASAVQYTLNALRANHLKPQLMIDCSHGNSLKNYQQQYHVAKDIAAQIAAGNHAILGVMLESYLQPGKQALSGEAAPCYGQSITDACLGWRDSVSVLEQLASAVKQRRASHKSQS